MQQDFDSIKLTLASAKQILSWSHGEVKKAETINYRTQRAEVDGLMCEKIFGPTNNYQCYCGKYKKVRYKGIVCDKCGVEVTHNRVRRERMGHIKLAAPIVHIWYSHGIPNKLSFILDIPKKKIESVIYFARYIVVGVDEEKKKEVRKIITQKQADEAASLKKELDSQIKKKEKEINEQVKDLEKQSNTGLTIESTKRRGDKSIAELRELFARKEMKMKEKFNELLTLQENIKIGEVISEEQNNDLLEAGDKFFDVLMGAEGIEKMLAMVNLEAEIKKLHKLKDSTKSKAKQRKIISRLRIITGMFRNNVEATSIVMRIVPVIPPALRPILQLPGGRFATSDLNDLYRRVINRNNRLQRLIDLGAPEIILRNEKRMLQEAVDALIDNSHREGRPVLNSRGQPYKSLSDILRGKQGRFRQNLLGKRVDYSGRAVIVSGADLNLYECGLPKVVALELFKPFVIREIIGRGLSPNIKSAKNYLEEQSDAVWDILEDVIKERPVLLNRAPTLHKQGIQGFYPKLVEGNAIRIHPMVCKGFNADFDGDQMAVHVPISQAAVKEVIERMMPDSNMLLLANGNPVVNLNKDMLFGVYLLTRMNETEEKESRFFSSPDDAVGAYEAGQIDENQKIRVMISGKIIVTSLGRIIFNEGLPEGFGYVNEAIDGPKVSQIVAECLTKFGKKPTIDVLDYFKNIGFKFASHFAFSVSMNDLVSSDKRDDLLKKAETQIENLNESYYNGLITEDELKSLSEEIWMKSTEEISDETWKVYEEKSIVFDLEKSGAYPVKSPTRQISGIRGLILDPLGNIVELPLRSNYNLGLTPLEYFVASRGTRKGLTDTALKTSGSGYLTRKMIDVSHDVITRIDDCETTEGVVMTASQNRRLPFVKRITGRYTTEEVLDPKSGKKLMSADEEITEELAKELVAQGVETVYVRSPLTCKAAEGLCCKCYGYNLGTTKLVEKGVAVGVIAGQAMGEAATQLTLDTKHLAGRAGTDITQGLPRVEELFEARVPKGRAMLSDIDGKVKLIKDEDGTVRSIIVSQSEVVEREYELKKGDKLLLKKGGKIVKNKKIIETKDGSFITAAFEGEAKIEKNKVSLKYKKEEEKEYKVDEKDDVIVEDGVNVIKGAYLTVGSIDPGQLLKLKGLKEVEQYIIDNIQETYGLQGISLDDKHVEVVVRKMASSVNIEDPGDSQHLPAEFTNYYEVLRENKELKKDGKKLIKFKRRLLGITSSSINTESFLSAASFQEVVRVLSDASLIGKVDKLRGLKENVIIGSPVPLGEYLR